MVLFCFVFLAKPRSGSTNVSSQNMNMANVIITKEKNVYLTNKEASTVLCSVVKHAGSG